MGSQSPAAEENRGPTARSQSDVTADTSTLQRGGPRHVVNSPANLIAGKKILLEMSGTDGSAAHLRTGVGAYRGVGDSGNQAPAAEVLS